jgi:hypothetical protein
LSIVNDKGGIWMAKIVKVHIDYDWSVVKLTNNMARQYTIDSKGLFQIAHNPKSSMVFSMLICYYNACLWMRHKSRQFIRWIRT